MKPKIRYVRNLRYVAKAICPYWIDEIHVDLSLCSDPLRDEIIKHELKHYRLIKKALKSRQPKRGLILVYNNLWDTYDCWRIELLRLITTIRRWRKRWESWKKR